MANAAREHAPRQGRRDAPVSASRIAETDVGEAQFGLVQARSNSAGLTAATVLRLQRAYGNTAVTRLVSQLHRPTAANQPRAAPLVQRNYVYDDTQNVWFDGSGAAHGLTQFKTVPAGVELTFTPAISGPVKTFTVPAEARGKTFQTAAVNGITYANPKDASDATTVKDLRIFSGIAASPGARTALPAIPETDLNTHFHNTSFLTRVSVVPLKRTESDDVFKANEVFVADVKMSNDRPPTKFGTEGQRSHTVAWSLLRTAIQGLAGQPLNAFLAMLWDMTSDLGTPSADAAASASKALATRIKAGFALVHDPNTAAAIYAWQRLASDLTTGFVHCYQLSEAATYADGQAIGHGEPGHIAQLASAEAGLKLGRTLANEELEAVKDAAKGMLDIKQSLSAKVIATVLHHWVNNLYLAYPNLMNTHSKDIVAGVRTRLQLTDDRMAVLKASFSGRDPTIPLAAIAAKDATTTLVSGRDMAVTALPKSSQSTFVANVHVVPEKSVLREDTAWAQSSKAGMGGGAAALGHYRIGDLKIDELVVADDRPNTRFGALQRSHTVAWTLVRRHLMFFGGKPAANLVNFILNELTILQEDIARQEESKHITFDARGEATQLRARLAVVVNDSTGFPIHQWQTRLSELVETYITLYQLSNSATYSKEERPQGHGESTAIGVLDEANQKLASFGDDDAKKKEYLDEQGRYIYANAVKLVDAAIATANLGPRTWSTAIDHWLTLLQDRFPSLMSIDYAVAAMKSAISVAEPAKELLAGYKNPDRLTARDKLLINLYENAKFELRSLSHYFSKDLQSNLRLQFSEFGPPNYDTWAEVVKKTVIVSISSLTDSWQGKHLQQYFQRSRVANRARDLPGRDDFNTLVSSVTNYFDGVRADRDKLIAKYTDALKRLANTSEDKPTIDFVNSQQEALRGAVSKALDEALEVSLIANVRNYQTWFDILVSLESEKKVDYNSLKDAISKKKKRDEGASVSSAEMDVEGEEEVKPRPTKKQKTKGT